MARGASLEAQSTPAPREVPPSADAVEPRSRDSIDPLAPKDASPPIEGGELRRGRHHGVWPFWSRDEYEDGGRRETALFGAYRDETLPGGDTHHRLFPFYSAETVDGGEDHRFAIYPLLWLHRRSPDADHDIVLPFYASWRSAGGDRDTLLWPLFHLASTTASEPPMPIPTLFAHGIWRGGDHQRLGVPLLVDLFDRTADDQLSAWQVGALFPWGRPSRSGVPIARGRSSADGSWHSHAFPLWAAGEGPDPALAPTADALLDLDAEPEAWLEVDPTSEGLEIEDELIDEPTSADEDSRPEHRSSYFVTLPFGTSTDERGVETYGSPLLLSAWWSKEPTSPAGDDGELGVRLLAFLFGYERRPRFRTLQVVPFWIEVEDEEDELSWFAASALWIHIEDEAQEETDDFLPLFLSHWGSDPEGYSLDVLWPLGHHSERADGERTRALPFWDSWREGERHGFGVGGLLWRRYRDDQQSIARDWYLWPLGLHETTPDSSTTWAIPFFGAHSSQTGDYRESVSFVAPSWFSSTTEQKSASGEWRATYDNLQLWPLWGRVLRSANEREVDSATWFTLAPLLQLRRTWMRRTGEGLRGSVHAPWPLVEHAWTESSRETVVFPVLFTGVEEERAYWYTWPLVSVETGRRAEIDFWTRTSLVQWTDDEVETSFRLFPLLFDWTMSREEERITGPLWLFQYDHSGGASPQTWFHLVPLGFGSWREDRGAWGLFPLVYERDFGSDEIERWPIGRFLFAWNGLRNERESYDSFLWKVVEWSRDDVGDWDFRVLHRLFVSRDVEGQSEFVINPLFQTFHDERTGESELAILKILWRSETREGRTTHRLLLVPLWSD